jgi:hypothetical protein
MAFMRSWASSKFRRIQERVAVDAAEAGELSHLLKAGDGAEDVGLRAVFQLGLEADHVPQRAERIVLAQLDDGVAPSRRGWCGLVRPTGFIGP